MLHGGKHYQAIAAVNTVEPGQWLPRLFYLLFSDPERMHTLLLGLQALVMGAQVRSWFIVHGGRWVVGGYLVGWLACSWWIGDGGNMAPFCVVRGFLALSFIFCSFALSRETGTRARHRAHTQTFKPSNPPPRPISCCWCYRRRLGTCICSFSFSITTSSSFASRRVGGRWQLPPTLPTANPSR